MHNAFRKNLVFHNQALKRRTIILRSGARQKEIGRERGRNEQMKRVSDRKTMEIDERIKQNGRNKGGKEIK